MWFSCAAGAEQGLVKGMADGKRRQWTTVRRGTADQVPAAGSGHGGTGGGWLWQPHGCALGVRTMVAQVVAQTQGTEGALGRGGSGSREARWERRARELRGRRESE